jgi:hypothetical protein
VSRDLTAAMEAAITGNRMRRIRFVELEFATGFLRLCTAGHNVIWDGKEWTGAGGLLAVSAVKETRDLVATECVVTLSGLPASIKALALAHARQNKPGRIWEGARDETTGHVIADPKLAFEGRLDVVDIDEPGNTCTVSVTYESRLADLLTPRERRYTHEDQQIDFPGDMGFEFVAGLQDKVLNWGRA